VSRLPLLAGSRLAVVNAPDDAVLLPPPAPLDPIADVEAATGEALRFPLSGPPLEGLATKGGRATIVVEPPSLPLPGAPEDPRREALAAVVDELERAGMPAHRQTILIAGGLERRAARRELEMLLRPERARDFRGEVVVHDCEQEGLRALGDTEGRLRVSPALLDADLVVTATAAETVLHGGPAALLAAGSARMLRGAAAESLLEPTTSAGWQLATGLERELARSVPVTGVSLVLDHPRFEGRLRGYPWSGEARGRIARSRLRIVLGALPFSMRRRALQAAPRHLAAVAALAGPPSVAHVEALLRGVAVRAAPLPEQLDAIVVPTPWKSLHQPREALNPITATSVGLGHALRLWRDRPPLRRGGTVVLLHGFGRAFGGHGPQAPYRRLFAALRDDRTPGALAEAERTAAEDDRALAAYRAGRAPHPLLPFVDWEGCAPALGRAGRVIIGACRDAGAARALGFVPSHSATAAVEMAREMSGGGSRLGVLLAPPYPPLVRGA
jgi:hypothetical protein